MSDSAGRLVLIDRDGVINRDSVNYIKSAAEWVPLPGSLEAIAELTAAGFEVAVITNQSGIGRGLFSVETLAAIHQTMLAAIESAGGRIAGVFYCPHRPDENCECRKPKPKLLLDAARHLGIPMSEVVFVGDKQSDLDAAIAAGARPILVGDRVPDPVPADVERYADLAAAAGVLVSEGVN